MNHRVDSLCTEQVKWCPFPAGRWDVRLQKLGGPPGDVTLWFVVGKPPPAKPS